jgi:hypothetical protein
VYVATTQPILAVAPPEEGKPRSGAPDSIFYYDVVDRVRGGQAYYDAVKREFDLPVWKRGTFRPTSPFNWRTPIDAWLLAFLPGPGAGISAVALLALLATIACFIALGRTQGPAAATLTVLLVGPFSWCFLADVYLFTELWAGILIALSVAAYALERRALAVTAALVALFFRELVLPYCLLCLVISLYQRRRAETLGWLGGLILFAIFYAWHIHEVRQQISGESSAQLGTWLRFGGTAFVLATTQLGNVFLTAVPAWVTGVALPLALLGLAGWRGETGLRPFLTCVGYLAFFSVAGQPPYNAYWGLLIGPLLMLGLAGLPNAFRDLTTMAFRRQHSAVSGGG